VNKSTRWVLGGCLGVASLLGLFIASYAGHGPLYWTGLIIFFLAVAAIFYQIRAAFDAKEKGETLGKAEGKENPYLVPGILAGVAVGSVLFHLVSPWWWGPIASNWQYIDDTISLTFWITGIVFVIVLLFMAYCAYRYRHREGSKADYEPESTKLELGLTIVTAIGVAAMLAPGLVVWNRFIDVPEGASEIEVVGTQWQWSYRLPGKDGEFGTTATEFVSFDNPLGVNPDDPAGQDDVIIESGDLHLPLGIAVKVLLRSRDVLHSFYVPEFRTKMDMIPGTVTYLWFEPTRTGEFQILCAELCGTGHAYMRGNVIVVEEREYEAWLSGQQTFAQLGAATRERELSRLEPADGSKAP
jgi:cytochrome c oxidase subunit 2